MASCVMYSQTRTTGNYPVTCLPVKTFRLSTCIYFKLSPHSPTTLDLDGSLCFNALKIALYFNKQIVFPYLV